MTERRVHKAPSRGMGIGKISGLLAQNSRYCIGAMRGERQLCFGVHKLGLPSPDIRRDTGLQGLRGCLSSRWFEACAQLEKDTR